MIIIMITFTIIIIIIVVIIISGGGGGSSSSSSSSSNVGPPAWTPHCPRREGIFWPRPLRPTETQRTAHRTSSSKQKVPNPNNNSLIRKQ